MKLRERITTEISPDGSILEVGWKQRNQRIMLLPDRAVCKIPNQKWKRLMFPFDPLEDVLHGKVAKVTFVVFLPAYADKVEGEIGEKLQKIFYDFDSDAYLQRKGAITALIRKMAKKAPQILLAGHMTSISNYQEDYENAIRFTSWSIIPGELLQIKMIWESQEEPDLVDVEITLLFDQRMINEDFSLRINRRGHLNFDISKWDRTFCLDEVMLKELPQLDCLKTPPLDISISSTESTVEEVQRRPKKRIKLEDRFKISSDEE